MSSGKCPRTGTASHLNLSSTAHTRTCKKEGWIIDAVTIFSLHTLHFRFSKNEKRFMIKFLDLVRCSNACPCAFEAHRHASERLFSLSLTSLNSSLSPVPVLSGEKGTTAWPQPPFPGGSSLLVVGQNTLLNCCPDRTSLDKSAWESQKWGRLLQNNDSLLQRKIKQSGLCYVFQQRCPQSSHTRFDWFLAQNRKGLSQAADEYFQFSRHFEPSFRQGHASAQTVHTQTRNQARLFGDWTLRLNSQTFQVESFNYKGMYSRRATRHSSERPVPSDLTDQTCYPGGSEMTKLLTIHYILCKAWFIQM